MKSINLYKLTRVDDRTINNYLTYLSKNKEDSLKPQEIESINFLTSQFMKLGNDLNILDGFYLSYVIPQISKEFDILKIGKNAIINIELKRDNIGLDRIKKQLLQNSYYLKPLEKPIFSFTFVQNTKECFALIGEEIVTSSVKDIFSVLKKYKEYETIDIDSFFKPINYLISPTKDWDKFLNDEYFLTNEQKDKQKELLNDLGKYEFYGISGESGTGKTLMIFDIAKKLSLSSNCCLIIFGKLAKTYASLHISCKIPNLDIISVESFLENMEDIISKYEFFIFDEIHNLEKSIFDKVTSEFKKRKVPFIFSYLTSKVLVSNKKYIFIENMIKSLDSLKIYHLKGTISINKEIYYFTKQMFNLNEKNTKNCSYSEIDLIYSDTVEETENLIKFYKKREYTFINYWDLKNNDVICKKFKDFDILENMNQEFDSAIVYINKDFGYDELNKLKISRENNIEYSYEYLFYKSITRIKNKLAILVVNNPSFFDKILEILNQVE